MRASWAKVCSFGLLLAGLPASGSVTSLRQPNSVTSGRVVEILPLVGQEEQRESLRQDVVAHPAEFVVFETKVGAEQFVAQHLAEVRLETNRSIVILGVVGYWQGKTMVVLPWEPVRNFQ